MAVTKRPALSPTVFHGIVTVAPEMRAFFKMMERVARTDSTVLVRGESGTGKELVARGIHELSQRRAEPFQAVNCATFTPELLASELFGHVRGAFTGAVRDHQGLFERADKGTVFLDEIAEMPLELQARLLRVLEQRTFVPVGGTNPVTADIRLVSATHRALRHEAAEGRFRDDLMYRVRVVPLFLPRLVERDGDIEALLWHFIDRENKRGQRHIEAIDSDALKALLEYEWPGNVRELRNAVEHAFALGESEVVKLCDLPPELRGEAPRMSGTPSAESEEKKELLAALEKAGGAKGKAAEILGVSRSTLWRKLREHHVV